MSSSREDAMFKAAIEASLRDSRAQNRAAEPSSPPAQEEVVDLTFDSGSENGFGLQEVFPKSKSVVGSDTDNEAAEDDDEDLKAAIALSLQGVHREDDKDDDNESTTTKASEQSPKAQGYPQPSGFLGMDRKKMEEERLARLAKRKADDGDKSPRPQPAKAAKTSSSNILDSHQSKESPRPQPVTAAEISSSDTLDSHKSNGPPRPQPANAIKTSSIKIPDTHGSDSFTQRGPSSREATQPICKQFAANDPNCGVRPTARSVPQWPLGAVKQTAIARRLRQHNDITIEEVLQRGDLEAAVFSSFMFDVNWLLSKVNIWQTPVTLVMHAKEEEMRREWKELADPLPNVHLCFPPMDPLVNCMHSKLMLLFHPEYLRIVVPTANLTSTDWGENSLMENTVFLIDLPKRAEKDMPPNSKPPFYHDMVYFLNATTLDESIMKKLENFDFSETARYAFVHSIGGSHHGEAWNRNGFCGLGRAVASLGLRSLAPIKIDYVTSSVGSLTEDLLRAIHLACKGDDGLTDYAFRTMKRPFTFQAGDPIRSVMLNCAKEWRDRFHVYFPSEQTVRATHEEPDKTAGTICFNSNYWNKLGFPRRVMRDCEGKRDVLMHNKLLFVSPSKPIILHDKTVCKGWAYVGSANLSESAWGRLVQDRKTKQPKLNCRNWECGVIVPVTAEYTDAEFKALKNKTEQEQSGSSSRLPDAYQRLAKTNIDEMKETRFPYEIFRDTIPVPMKTPAKEFSPDDHRGFDGFRKPWFFMEDR